jgi:hypothetical protein
MALGSSQPLTEISVRNLPGGKERPALRADNHTAICEPSVYQMWQPRRLTTVWASTAYYRDSFTLPYLPCIKEARIFILIDLRAVGHSGWQQSTILYF